MRLYRYAASMLLLCGLCACDRPPPARSKTAVPNAQDDGLPLEAQPTLRKMKLYLGPAELDAELAMTYAQKATGMMFRTNILDSSGMLFVFTAPHQASFWMKNTTVPLSAAYIDPAGVILEIHDLIPLELQPVVAQSINVQYVLETARGWFEKHQVQVGAVVRTEKGSLRETFFRR